MSAAPAKDRLIEDILTLADSLFRQLLPTVPKDLLALDISMPQAKILLILYVHGPRRMSDIASELDVTLPTATSLIDRLVEKQYVMRETQPDDRRVVLCELTEMGQRAIGRTWQSARDRSQELLQAMNADKLELLADALRAMQEASSSPEGNDTSIQA
jgi:DNA-binding MarR family transcriptional regulator